MIYTKEQIKQNLVPVFDSYHVKKAMLFGSYAKDSANEKSDVDLYVDSNLKGLRFVGLIESIKNALGGKDIDLLDKSHLEKDSKILNEISHTGITIYER